MLLRPRGRHRGIRRVLCWLLVPCRRTHSRRRLRRSRCKARLMRSVGTLGAPRQRGCWGGGGRRLVLLDQKVFQICQPVMEAGAAPSLLSRRFRRAAGRKVSRTKGYVSPCAGSGRPWADGARETHLSVPGPPRRHSSATSRLRQLAQGTGDPGERPGRWLFPQRPTRALALGPRMPTSTRPPELGLLSCGATYDRYAHCLSHFILSLRHS